MISMDLSVVSYCTGFVRQHRGLPSSTSTSTLFIHRSCNPLRKTPTVLVFSNPSTKKRESQNLDNKLLASANSNTSYRSVASPSDSFNQTVGLQLPTESKLDKKKAARKRVFFLDVNPLCYAGKSPSLHSFGNWVSLLFSQVTQNDPVIAVIDGENGNQHRRQLLPSYKSHRIKSFRKSSYGTSPSNHVGRQRQDVINFLRKCHVPVVKVSGHEADDVIATLVGQVLQRGYRAVIASPDKDFKQLISDDVQIVMPMADLGRWSFYTLRHYKAQYGCDPQSDLSLRCILGDEVDGVPGIQHVVPAFGRKSAVKLIKKHGSLESLLNAASVRTVGRPYIQDALTKYVDYLRRNYEVLSLKRDVDVKLDEEWLVERDTSNDLNVLSEFFNFLKGSKGFYHNNSTKFKWLNSER